MRQRPKLLWLTGLVVFVLAAGTYVYSQTDAPIPAATSGPTASTSPTDTPPPLNRLEVKVVDVLGRLGVKGMRAQLPFNNANIWADFGSAGQLFVNAWPPGSPRGESTVVDERQLAGARVQRVQTPSGPQLIYRFDCSGDMYEISRSTPPGFTDMDAFVTSFIRALGCGA